ncbi:MAG: hypothetical protein PVH73_07590 [Candidatus Bathyarchaeota archaeon]
MAETERLLKTKVRRKLSVSTTKSILKMNLIECESLDGIGWENT